MAERIPTEVAERLLADGELLPIVTSISADAHLRLLTQRRDLAADLLDARRAEARYRGALETVLGYAAHVPVEGAQLIARAALSGEETSG